MFFKLNGSSIQFRIMNNIFAVPASSGVSDSSGSVFGSLINNNKMHANSTGNIICWLGSGAFPYDNPDPTRFTVQTGATAQNTWNDAVAEWWDTFPGHRFSFDPEAP